MMLDVAMRVPLRLLMRATRPIRIKRALVIAVTMVAVAVAVRAIAGAAPTPEAPAELVNVPHRSGSVEGGVGPILRSRPHTFVIDDSLFGLSGALRVRLLLPN